MTTKKILCYGALGLAAWYLLKGSAKSGVSGLGHGGGGHGGGHGHGGGWGGSWGGGYWGPDYDGFDIVGYDPDPMPPVVIIMNTDDSAIPIVPVDDTDSGMN